MNKKLSLIAISGFLIVSAVTALAVNNSESTIAKGSHVHSGYHYNEVLATSTSYGHKEHWTCCGCHKVFSAKPDGTFVDAKNKGAQYGEFDESVTYQFITFDKQGGTGGTDTLNNVIININLPSIEVPTKGDLWKFDGYYSEKDGAGTKYYDSTGTCVDQLTTKALETTLYAHWVDYWAGCDTLEIGREFDADGSYGTAAAAVGTKWYVKANVPAGSYITTCTNGSLYDITFYNEYGIEVCKLDAESTDFQVIQANYATTYNILIEKVASGNFAPMFYVASIQNMTSPFDSGDANNSITLAADEYKCLSFALSHCCTIKFNDSFGEYDKIFLLSSDMATSYSTEYVDFFQTTEDLPDDTYYIIGYGDCAKTVNYYMICGHNFSEGSTCLVCGHECEHSSLNSCHICYDCGTFLGRTDVRINGDFVYPGMELNLDEAYKFELEAGQYQIIEDLGEDCVGFEYYVYKEGSEIYLTMSKSITIEEDGTYYLIVEDNDSEAGMNAFQFLRNVSSDLFGSSHSYFDIAVKAEETYFYYINVETAGLYCFDMNGGSGNITIEGASGTAGTYNLSAQDYVVKVEVDSLTGEGLELTCQKVG